MGIEGVRHFADVLKVNRVRDEQHALIRSYSMHDFEQTLHILDVEADSIKDNGARYLADTLKVNEVG